MHVVAAFMKNRKQSPFFGIGNCSYSSGTPARIALAILALFYAVFAFDAGKSVLYFWSI